MPTNNRVKCLIVDDVPENLIALEALLQRDGVEFLKAHSASEALELLLLHDDVALALLDVQMPQMNGFELAELIRGSERTRHIPLIFMTAGSREQNWQFKGYESGAVDFLYKPIAPHILTTKVNVFFELHQRKQELARQLQATSEALRINEMFMAVLSHDLRTPLQSIKATATLLKRQPDAPRIPELAQRLLDSSQRMAGMIEDLLDVTRIRQAGGLQLSVAPLDLAEVIEHAVAEVQSCFPERRIDLRQQGNPQGSWDKQRLGQILSNLLGNAMQHGHCGQPVSVLLDGTAADAVLVAVSNAGTIPPELLPVLFNPFRAGERQPGQHQGLGLGLFIAQQIARSHQGEIAVRSDDGTTTFTVRLPRQSAAATARPGAHAQHSQPCGQ